MRQLVPRAPPKVKAWPEIFDPKTQLWVAVDVAPRKKRHREVDAYCVLSRRKRKRGQVPLGSKQLLVIFVLPWAETCGFALHASNLWVDRLDGAAFGTEAFGDIVRHPVVEWPHRGTPMLWLHG